MWEIADTTYRRALPSTLSHTEFLGSDQRKVYSHRKKAAAGTVWYMQQKRGWYWKDWTATS